MRTAPHSPLVPRIEPPMSRGEKVALTAILAVGLGIVVVFACGLLRAALRLAEMVGGW